MSTNLPPLTSTALAALLTATNAFSGATINGLGDSILGAYSTYAVYNSATYQSQLANNVPAWATGTGYVVGNLVKSGGYAYRCTIAGTSGATAPTGIVTAFSDGGATWASINTLDVRKFGQSMLTWAEIYNDRLHFDQTLGYGGIVGSLLKIIVVNGGSGYVPGTDTITLPFGGAGTLQISNGAITGVTITNAGNSVGAGWYYVINSSTGTGAVLSVVQAGTGTFGVPGARVEDMVARLPDVLANKPSILIVHGGTNNVALATQSGTTSVANIVAATIAGLRTCYETSMLAGIKVVAVPVTPRAYNPTIWNKIALQRINRWIRAYCRGAKWANPLGFTAIALADPTGYWTDGTQGYAYPIGGLGNVANAVTVDGLHPSNRGAQYTGYCIAKAAERWVGTPQAYAGRSYSADDGYDSLWNPGGNMLEGFPWQASTGYVVGQQVSNGAGVYRCTAGGTSAASGGPTGTGTPTDGGVTWAYTGPSGASVMAGTAGAANAVSGVYAGGVVPSGWSFGRGSGTATGTVTSVAESPWSNGQLGQRFAANFSLGGSGAGERWDFVFAHGSYGAYALYNIQPSDLGVTLFVFEMEVEISNVANLTRLQNFVAAADTDKIVAAGALLGGAGEEQIGSNDQLVIPNNGKMTLRTAPFILPPNLVNFVMGLFIGFNASGAAASATLGLKVNYAALLHAGVA